MLYAVRGTSLVRISEMGLPMSRVSHAANSSRRDSMMAAALCRIALRWVGLIRGHGPSSKARRAAATARSASAAEPSATTAATVLSMGEIDSNVAPSRESTNSPSMKWRTTFG
jgi:hypothetical protein